MPREHAAAKLSSLGIHLKDSELPVANKKLLKDPKVGRVGSMPRAEVLAFATARVQTMLSVSTRRLESCAA